MRAAPVLLAPLLLAACASAAPPPGPVSEWESRHGRGHPLVGRIWDVSESRFIDAGTLEERLARARFVLLGERHDNPDHHRLQARLVGAMIAAGRRPAVGFEMLTADQAPAVERFLATRPTDAAGLGPAVGWEKSGWPPWRDYQPIADAAVRAGLPIVAANLDRDGTRAVRREGLAALGPDLVRRLGLDRPLDPATRADMVEEAQESHCGQVPEAMVGPMIDVQRARDAYMAARLAEAGRTDGAVLVTGSGHVRRDRGIPVYLAALVEGAPIASLILHEVSDRRADPRAYELRAERDGRVLYHYAWFTPRWDDTDPCEKFRSSLERLRDPDAKERRRAPDAP